MKYNFIRIGAFLVVLLLLSLSRTTKDVLEGFYRVVLI